MPTISMKLSYEYTPQQQHNVLVYADRTTAATTTTFAVRYSQHNRQPHRMSARGAYDAQAI